MNIKIKVMNIKIKVDVIMHMMLIICMWAAAEAKTGCQNRCGNVTIPYPFGIGDGCNVSHPSFVISCNSTSNPPKAYLGKSDIQVLDVNVNYGELRVLARVFNACFPNSSNEFDNVKAQNFSIDQSKFYISNSRNKFIAVGCDTMAVILGSETYATGCMSVCNGSCTGIGCCQTAIPKMMSSYEIYIQSCIYNPNNVSSFNPCRYAFVVEDGAYNFSTSDLTNFNGKDKLPMVLDWTIGKQSCSKAEKDRENYACKENSICIDSENGPGYFCSCIQGFSGNPYLSHGCQDIDECLESNPCLHESSCINTVGGYNCYCPNGYEGDGLKNGKGCIWRNNKELLRVPYIIIVLGLFFSFRASMATSLAAWRG